MRRFALTVLPLLLALPAPAAAAPEGTLTWGIHVTLAARWLDPADTEAFINPFMVLYAVHDALVKPMPAGENTPSLAESWSQSKDGLVYEFVLRKSAKFHNGDPVTAEDVKFSFDRYKGAAAKLLHDRVREVQTVDPGRVRFHLKEPWPDFMTFYGTSATGAAWIVPKKYVEKVGDDGFKKAPVGAGPYRVVSFTPGIELVMEAFDGYWRKTPAVKRQALNQAETLCFSHPTGSLLHRSLEFARFFEPPAYDPPKAKQLLAEAGYPNGFDAGDLTPLPPYTTFGEAVANYLGAVGI